jgi:hypothetical protein
MGRETTGYSATTKKHTIRGVGNLYLNIVEAELLDAGEVDPITAALVGAIVIGATKGGITLSIKPVWQELDIDGLSEHDEGNRIITDYDVMFSTQVVEAAHARLTKYIPGTEAVAVGNGLTRIGPKAADCGWPEYITNVAWIGKQYDCGVTKPIVAVLRKALNKDGITISTAPRASAGISVAFKGHADPVAIADAWQLYTPTAP